MATSEDDLWEEMLEEEQWVAIDHAYRTADLYLETAGWAVNEHELRHARRRALIWRAAAKKLEERNG